MVGTLYVLVIAQSLNVKVFNPMDLVQLGSPMENASNMEPMENANPGNCYKHTKCVS